MPDTQNITAKPQAFFRSTEGRLGMGCLAVLVCIILVICGQLNAQATAAQKHNLVKATISDCTATSESESQINTSKALLEGLSFVQGNPFFMNTRTAMTSKFLFALPTDSWVEKAEWTYDDAGRVKSCQFLKSTNPLSSATYSYDKNGMVSKIVGWRYTNDPSTGGSAIGSTVATRHDFEASFVNEQLGKDAFGANKTTVVHSDSVANDTVVYTYDKDKNLNEVKSTGGHPWTLTSSFVTAFKVTKETTVMNDETGEGEYFAPVYNEKNQLVSLKTGVVSNGEVTMNGDEYLVQYSGSKFSKVDYYQGDTQVRYYQFHYTGDDLTAIRVYKKGGEQLYTISFTWK